MQDGTDIQMPNELKELQAEVSRLRQEIHTRSELARVVTSFTRPDELMPNILEVLCKGFGASGGALFFKEKGSEEIKLKATYKFDASYAMRYQKIHLGTHLTGIVAQTGEGMVIKDASADGRTTRDVVDILKYRSAVVVPVTAEGEVVGIIALVNVSPGFFSETDLKKLEFMAAHISLAIVNSFLNQEVMLERERTLDILDRVDEGVFEAEMPIPFEKVLDVEAMTINFYRNALFTLINPSFIRQCGLELPLGSPVFKGFEDIQFFRMLKEVLDKGDVKGIERKWLGEEERQFEVSIVRVDKEGKIKGIKGTRRDVTNRVRMEEKLKESKSQTELYMDLLSHDVSNINTSVLGFLDLMGEKLTRSKQSEDLRRFIAQSRSALERSNQMISKVKSLSKIQRQTPELSITDIEERVLKNVEKVRKQYSEREIIVNYEGRDAGPYIVRCDEMIDEMFLNLLRNSIANTIGSDVEIDLDIRGFKYNNMDGFLLSISDRGKGIPDDMKERLFDRRFRQDGNLPGSGLGLSVIRGIAERYNGRLWVEDRVQGNHRAGTRFMVFLPSARFEGLVKDA
jgi:signal transduction histidine kinase